MGPAQPIYEIIETNVSLNPLRAHPIVLERTSNPLERLDFCKFHLSASQAPPMTARVLEASNLEVIARVLEPSPLLCNLPLLDILDLSHNNFSETLPKCLKYMTSLVYGISNVSYYESYFGQTTLTSKGRELAYNKTLFWVKSIDLSSNNLESEISEEVTSLIALSILNLSNKWKHSFKELSTAGNSGSLTQSPFSKNSSKCFFFNLFVPLELVW
ncbi:PREDICTED: LRR receptor [Prunus dulcis]|uniref:PREDICTED: LRR receptor n=1 Tax=Prunus dulcis TaxID=3755 RepID=A0A5E4F218_PRUDU|nr:PREDICTED: LRR receptor [Prunus dulcis]